MNEQYRERIFNNKIDEDQLPQSRCCDNPFVESRDGNKVCLNCGIIFERTFVGNERRAYTIEEIQNRRRTEPRWRDFGP